MASEGDAWPSLPYSAWRETCDNLQLRTQIVGKLRLAQAPWLNHSWHVAMQLTARGLTTGPIPCGGRHFQVDFDFVEHRLLIRTSDGGEGGLPLAEQTIADFYRAVMESLERLGIGIRINTLPNEIPDPIPFEADRQHRAYDPQAVQRFLGALLQAQRVLETFRSGFIGKSSPVHFFWGSFDLAVTRFSGAMAPPHPGGVPGLADDIVREAYSHQVCSAGFWPGAGIGFPAFYAYAYPEPPGFPTAPVAPKEASYSDSLREFVLPYDAVRSAASPDEVLMTFLQSTYEAAADGGGWDRASLECPPGRPRVPRSCRVPAA